mmetsp:Transcript_69202/g.195367  ORF Transcript_69202/g.195367 Transcript_69202/m.195367 type:complete len:212 (+) Transcript_69202:335-970(+)
MAPMPKDSRECCCRSMQARLVPGIRMWLPMSLGNRGSKHAGRIVPGSRLWLPMSLDSRKSGPHEVRGAFAALAGGPRPRALAHARDRGRVSGRSLLSELEGHFVGFALRAASPGGSRELLQWEARSISKASSHRLKLAPPTDVLKHHLAIPRILVCPVDDDRLACHLLTLNFLKLDVENASVGTCDLLEAIQGAIEVTRATGTTIANHDHG